MAGIRSLPRAEQPDVYTEVTFGPYAAADFGGANTYVRLPFLPMRDAVITAVCVKCNTKPSVACSFSLAKVAGGVAPPTGAVSAANRVSEAVDANGKTNDTLFELPIHPTTGRKDSLNNNVVEAGGSLFIHSTAAATSMAGAFFSIRFRTKK